MKKLYSLLLATAISLSVSTHVNAQNTLSFSRVLLVSSTSQVPPGTVWKVVSVIAPTGTVAVAGGASFNAWSGTVCNSGTCGTTYSSVTTTSNFTSYMINGTTYSTTYFPIWLPAGATCSGVTYTSSSLPFTVNTGGGESCGGSCTGTCTCWLPNGSTTYTSANTLASAQSYLSVIEFTIVP